MQDVSIFVGYSRAHQKQVAALVALLRAAIKGLSDDAHRERRSVFQDVDSIPTGSRWAEEVDRAVKAADRVFIFWCRHAAESSEVDRELQVGLANGRPVWPVLLDSTPLPPALAGIQAVDLRGLGLHGDAVLGFTPAHVGDPVELVVLDRFADALGVAPDALRAGFARR